MTIKSAQDNVVKKYKTLAIIYSVLTFSCAEFSVIFFFELDDEYQLNFLISYLVCDTCFYKMLNCCMSWGEKKKKYVTDFSILTYVLTRT